MTDTHFGVCKSLFRLSGSGLLTIDASRAALGVDHNLVEESAPAVVKACAQHITAASTNVGRGELKLIRPAGAIPARLLVFHCLGRPNERLDNPRAPRIGMIRAVCEDLEDDRPRRLAGVAE